MRDIFGIEKDSKVIAVTNRKLCQIDFLTRINELAMSNVESIILREKDLSQEEYKELAKKVVEICKVQSKTCILHSFFETAIELGCENVHIPLGIFRENVDKIQNYIASGELKTVGTSVHSVEDALEAVELGATYLIAGHIFATDCKKGLAPRGLEFLEKVCTGVDAPVYAIGGMDIERIELVKQYGARGGCIMSGVMK